ncbi:DUF5703 domain-containing protein [Cohnella sp. WQ 127256]|uniref:glycosyl hydrolase family 95 catalytic domain-containing protein n=1 Tax=Cohnella sp. WQ 127256 TaxID=2938790 RepID=UPI002118B335|nr:hypothetical protein [Cohnella sp. WQ 127256]
MIRNKGWKQRFVSLTAASSLVVACLFVAPTAEASPTSHSFDTSGGKLNVDYASYLSKNDLVFNSPVTNSKSGMTIGNGRVGAQVWNTAGGLTMQLQGVDASQHGWASQGLVNLYSNPGFDSSYSSYQQRLSLYDGISTTKYDNNRTITIMGSPNSEVMGIHVDDSRTGVSNVTLDLSLWDVSTLSNGGDVPDLNTWKTVTTFVDPTVVGFSRGQTDAGKFGYTMAATVEGASFTTQSAGGSKVRLNITPTSSYTIWISVASRINAPGNDSVTQAKSLLNSVKSAGYATTLNNFKNWWHDFWNKSFVQYSNASGDADYLESFYYLSTYMIAAGSYGNYPSHFVNGAFSGVNDDDAGKWGHAFWYWNQRDLYHSFLASNHAEIVNMFNNLYARNFNTLKSYTMTRYGIDGIWLPETMGWDGNARHTINSDYTQDIMSTSAEAALNMYAQYKYTNDASYLSNTAYPFMKEAAKFMSAKLSYNSGTGKYYMASSNSHEQHWDVQNAIVDLVAVRALFPVAIQVSQQLGLDSTLRTQWQNILNNLVAYPVDPNDSTKYFPHTPPLSQNRNNENVILELAWPYSVTGIGYSDQQMLVNNFNSRPYPYGGNNIWDPAPIQAARLGLGDEAYLGMKMMIQRYQDLSNGRTTNTNGEFEYMGVNLIAMNESLLQSYDDKIRVFPGLPSDATMNAKFTLLASGGFLVSSEKEAGEIKYVGIRSQFGNSTGIVNPWGTQQVQVRRLSDNAIILTTSSNLFNISTAANTNYIVERSAKPLGSYSFAQLTGTANQGTKTITINGAQRSLGNGTVASGVPIGQMIAFTAIINGKFVCADSAGASPLIANAPAAGGWEQFTVVDAGGGAIALRAAVNNLYVTASSSASLIANSSTIGTAQKFIWINNSDGTFSLQAVVNNQYVCAENAGVAALIANRASIGPWEKFQR